MYELYNIKINKFLPKNTFAKMSKTDLQDLLTVSVVFVSGINSLGMILQLNVFYEPVKEKP